MGAHRLGKRLQATHTFSWECGGKLALDDDALGCPAELDLPAEIGNMQIWSEVELVLNEVHHPHVSGGLIEHESDIQPQRSVEVGHEHVPCGNSAGNLLDYSIPRIEPSTMYHLLQVTTEAQ